MSNPTSFSEPAAIEITHLSKRYGDFVAVDDISLTVAAGDFFGFLGPNGAGKTTTINAIVGLARVAQGTIKIFGRDVVGEWRKARPFVGLAPQEYNFDRYLSIRDVLIYQAGYYGLRGRDVGAYADELLERFGLTSKAKIEYTRLSGGMKRRLSLARALIHRPKLLILDEPTAGVDVELRLELWDLLREYNRAGMTIFLTTHYLEEAELLCRNIGIIEAGRVIALEPTETLVKRKGNATLRVVVDRAIGEIPVALRSARTRILPGERTIEIADVQPSQITGALSALEQANYQIENVEFDRANLQDVFLELLRR